MEREEGDILKFLTSVLTRRLRTLIESSILSIVAALYTYYWCPEAIRTPQTPTYLPYQRFFDQWVLLSVNHKGIPPKHNSGSKSVFWGWFRSLYRVESLPQWTNKGRWCPQTRDQVMKLPQFHPECLQIRFRRSKLVLDRIRLDQSILGALVDIRGLKAVLSWSINVLDALKGGTKWWNSQNSSISVSKCEFSSQDSFGGKFCLVVGFVHFGPHLKLESRSQLINKHPWSAQYGDQVMRLPKSRSKGSGRSGNAFHLVHKGIAINELDSIGWRGRI